MGLGRRRYLLALAAVLGVVPVLVAATASGGRTFVHAANPNCGATVTANITLTANMDCSGSTSDGLDIGAKNVTVNLNGHSITGSSGYTGILDNAYTGAVIENGTIDLFSIGVDITTSANNSHVSGMRILDSAGQGIIDADIAGTVITGNSVLDNTSTGIDVGTDVGVQVTSNQVEGNGGEGIDVESSTGAVITGNKALNNADSGILALSDAGTLSGNIANANGLDGIDASSPSTVALTPGLTVTGNRASFNGSYGFSADDTKDGGENVVQQNAASKQCVYIVCVAVSS